MTALSSFNAKVYNTNMKSRAMMLAGLVAIAATVTGGQEKTVGMKLGAPLEVGRQEMLFASIVSVCEDAQLNIYVLDRMEHAVFKFSPEGRLLAKFGQKGQGPGDFQSPGQIVFTPRGELAVLEDLYYVSFLKTDGTFIRRLDLNGRLGLAFIGPERFYGWVWRGTISGRCWWMPRTPS